MNEKFIREVIYYENYYLDFFNAQKDDVKKKFNWTLQLIATQDRIPEKFFKHLTGSKMAEKLKKEYLEQKK